MGFFDDLKAVGADLLAKGNVFAKEAAHKAQDAADMAKIKLDIAAKEREIKELYIKIGKAYYNEYKDDAVEFAEDIAVITAKYSDINELKSKYEMYKDAMKSEKEAQHAQEGAAAEDIEDAIVIVPAEEADVEDDASEAVEEVVESVEPENITEV